MKNPARDNSLGTGFYYAEEDYVGLGKRILILAIDFGVLAVAFWITEMLWYALPKSDTANLGLLWSFLIFVYAYLTILKASKIRTIGYRLIGAKVLTFKGKRPSVLRMTFRLLLLMLGPFNLVSDFIWVGVDPDRHSLRDRFAGTCVVRENAIPISEGPIHLAYYQAFCLSLMLPTVTRPRNA